MKENKYLDIPRKDIIEIAKWYFEAIGDQVKLDEINKTSNICALYKEQ
jgi:hypothetical protein